MGGQLARWFKYFDPMSGQLPYWPSQSANGIFWRARSLVRDRSREDIKDIARDVDAAIEAFFESERDRLEDLIRRDGRVDLFEDEGNYGSGIRSEAYDEFDIRNSENTTELDALTEALESFADVPHSSVLNVSEGEYLACFALSKLDDFVRGWNFEYDDSSEGDVRRESKEHSAADYRRAAAILLEAQDAVGRGELLRAKDELADRYEKRIDQFRKREQSAEANLQTIAEQVRAELLEKDVQRRKEQSASRNNVRHEQNREIKSRVLELFAADTAKFPSAEKAAKHFCGMLAEEGKEREQRTVAEWIRAYAKDNGLKWRA